jgi:predicted phosphodiesterase
VVAAFGLTTAWKQSWVQTDTFWMTAAGSALLIICGSGITYVARRLLTMEPKLKSVLYSIAAVIAIAAWANFMVFYPALDPIKTTRFLSNNIDMTLNNRSARIAGRDTIMAVGEAAEAEYHVYGHYAVHPVRRSELLKFLAEGRIVPPVVLVKSEDEKDTIFKSLTDSGFRTRRQITASKDSLVVYSKPARDSSTTSPEVLKFLLFGDTGNGSPQIYNSVHAVANSNEIKKIDGVFLLGDNVYHGSFIAESLQEYFIKPFAPLLALKIPFFAALGNHDYKDGRLRGEVEYPLFNMVGQRYYSLDFGASGAAVSFFICDSESLKAGDQKQLSWLSYALNASTSRWKILLLHEPIEATQFHHGPSEHLRQLLQPILKQVDVVFSGHNHFYERRKQSNGPLNITSGSGGQLKTGILPDDENRAVGYNASGTFLEVTVENNRLGITAWNEDGDLIDKVNLRSSDISG